MGTTHGACVLTRASRRRAVAQCNATLVLRDGQIAVLGAVVLKENFVVPVVGGNGAYAGARGTVTFRNRPTGGLTNVTVRLLP